MSVRIKMGFVVAFAGIKGGIWSPINVSSNSLVNPDLCILLTSKIYSIQIIQTTIIQNGRGFRDVDQVSFKYGPAGALEVLSDASLWLRTLGIIGNPRSQRRVFGQLKFGVHLENFKRGGTSKNVPRLTQNAAVPPGRNRRLTSGQTLLQSNQWEAWASRHQVRR